MSNGANVKFFPEPTGELYGWLLTTLVCLLSKEYNIEKLEVIVPNYVL